MSASLALAVMALTVTSGVTALDRLFQPIHFTLPKPPALISALSPNYALYNAEKVHNNGLRGPASLAVVNGNVYAITNGFVVNSSPCHPKAVANLKPRGCRSVKQCGMLVSIRPDRFTPGALLVLDAYRGMFRVYTSNGRVQQIMATDRKVAGRAPLYLRDFVQARDGTILISDASSRYDAVNDIFITVEGRPSGRILSLNGTSGVTASVLSDQFVYPSGMELTHDESGLLVAESGRARIVRVGLTSVDWMQVSTFSENLPGLPSNIRRSGRNTFWVGLYYIRHRGAPSVLDKFSTNPAARLWSMKQNHADITMRGYFRKYGMVVELNSGGKVIGSLHDPTGRVVAGVSEAQEYDGLLYFVDKSKNYMGRIVLPQGDGRVITVNSAIQVLRSRCQIRENQLAQARLVLRQYINRRTNSSSTQQQQQQQQQPTAQPTAASYQGMTPVVTPQTTQPLGGQQPSLAPQYPGLQTGVGGLTTGVTGGLNTGLTSGLTSSQQQTGLSQTQPQMSAAQMAALSQSQPGVGTQAGFPGTQNQPGYATLNTGVQGQLGTLNQASAMSQPQRSIAQQIADLQAKQAAQQAQAEAQALQLARLKAQYRQTVQQTQTQLGQQSHLGQQTQPQLGQQTQPQLGQQIQAPLGQQTQQSLLAQQTQLQQQAQLGTQQQLTIAQQIQLAQQAQPGTQSQQSLLAKAQAQLAGLTQLRPQTQQSLQQAQQAQGQLESPTQQSLLARQGQSSNFGGQVQPQSNLGSLLNQPAAAVQSKSLASQIAALQQAQALGQPTTAAQLTALNQAGSQANWAAQPNAADQLSSLNQAQSGSQTSWAAQQNAASQPGSQTSWAAQQNAASQPGSQSSWPALPSPGAQSGSQSSWPALPSPGAQSGAQSSWPALPSPGAQSGAAKSIEEQIAALNKANAAQLAALNQNQTPPATSLASQMAAYQLQQNQAQSGAQNADLAAQLASLGQNSGSGHTSGQALYQRLAGASQSAQQFG